MPPARLGRAVASSLLWFVLVRGAPGQAATRDTVLGNGLEVIIAEHHSLPQATVVLAVRTGAFTQDARQDGLAHLYEHLLFRTYPRGLSGFARDANAIEAGWNGVTTEDLVEYFLEAPSRNAGTAIKILSRLARGAKFSEKDMKAERPIVLDELARDLSSPLARLELEVHRRLWGDSWSRKDVGGDSASVSALPLTDIQRQFERYYVPNNAALIVSGDVDAAAVIAEAQDAFAPWTRGPDPSAGQPPITVTTIGRTTVVLMPADVSDVTFLIASQGPSAAPDSLDPYAVTVLSEILNEPSSAFQRRLVGRGLLQGVTANYDWGRYSGEVQIHARATVDHAGRGLLMLLNELQVMDALTGVDAEDIRIAARHRAVGDAFDEELANHVAGTLAQWWAGPGVSAYPSFGKRLSAVTPADLARVAASYFGDRPRVIGVLADARGIAAVRAALSAPGAANP
ncbi:MAG TPA: pitrilysin family protein [Gemmatimonadales bacterium]|nr:pitrilysin family protein [Gemmatimonadales bacterium]